jgi:hypothetical protein
MGEAKRKKTHPQLGSAAGVLAPQPHELTLPERVLDNFSHRHPDVWRYVDAVRRDPKDLGLSGTWESWCYLPINVATSLLHHLAQGKFSVAQAETFLLGDARLLAALAGWRMTKGVYVLDATMVQELFDSEVPDELPDELFLHLPEWSVYLATPGLEVMGGIHLHGFFAFVDDQISNHGIKPPELNILLIIDPKRSRPEALANLAHASFSLPPLERLAASDSDAFVQQVLNADNEFLCHQLVVALGQGSFHAANLERLGENGAMMPDTLEKLDGEAGGEDARIDFVRGQIGGVRAVAEANPEAFKAFVNLQLRFANLVLYLCSEGADIKAVRAPVQRRDEVQEKNRRGVRSFAAARLAHWEVGFRIGAKIRAAHAASELDRDSLGDGAAKRAHVRRAHWHSFWAGPKAQPNLRKKRIKWLHPMLINVDSADDLVPTVHGQ